jgi:hypothetical protein
MFTTLRTKLLVGLTPLLAIMVGLGLGAIVMLDHLGGRIEVILKENYRSVLAAEGMKEALERMDSAAQFAISGQDERARRQFDHYQPIFERHLDAERNNVTLRGEQELANRLTALYAKYIDQNKAFYALPASARSDAYFDPAVLRPAGLRAIRRVLRPGRRPAQDVHRHQGHGRRGAADQPGEHGGRGPPGPAGRRGLPAVDDRRPARLGGLPRRSAWR